MKKEDQIYLRNYSKAILTYPIFIVSLIFLLIEAFFGRAGEPISGLGFIWTIIFFINLVAIFFEISSAKLTIIIISIIIVILLFVFLLLPATLSIIFEELSNFEFNIGMTAEFYMVMTVIFAVILLFSFIGARFDYWVLERNEIFHRKGIFVKIERFPTRGLRIKKEIPDIIEFLFLRAGSITLFLSENQIDQLSTIININKKSDMIDKLLSDIEVKIEKSILNDD